ncbi:hypothetical protein VZT92_005589 [Zoarces viviparus]|uniref:Coiled-coil domain-containing protein 89 n=1 Tax=Zoarces viviparus TaxID=48416 RepID=A0AAW1FT66_ZOAVI
MATPQRNVENFTEMEGDTTELMDSIQEQLASLSTEDATETEMLRSRLDEQSTLISMLEQRADKELLTCQALEQLNADLEGRETDRQKELDGERQKANLLEKRNIERNYPDASQNSWNKQLSIKPKTHRYLINCMMQQQREAVEMCSDLKTKLQQVEEEHALEKINLSESITSLAKERDKLLDLSMERGKVIQEKQEEIQQLETKWKQEKKARAEAEHRFEQEAKAVNEDVNVKLIQSALDESKSNYRKLKEDFEAFRDHSNNLLLQERELNEKLRHFAG